jgi:uncharacterized membrane protein YkvA (DUF1232 family)
MEYNVNQDGSFKENQQLAEGVLKEALLLIPNFLKLLYRLLKNPAISTADKALLAGTVAYVLSPFDLLPDMIPFAGQVDDILLASSGDDALLPPQLLKLPLLVRLSVISGNS